MNAAAATPAPNLDESLSTAKTIATSTLEVVEAYKGIDSLEIFEAAAEELKSITKKIKRLTEMRLAITRPMDEAKKQAMDLFRPPLEQLASAEETLRKEMLAYSQAEKKKAEEQRRAAEAAQKEEQRKLEEKVATGKTEAEREEATAQLELAQVAPPPQPTVATPKAAGISVRENWTHEVLAFHDLVLAAADAFRAGNPQLMAYLEPNDKVLGAAARSLKANAKIPGVRIYNREGLAVRA